jgi:trehalose 6-phosphate synthase/phosphatase
MELERELSSYDVRFVNLKGIVEVIPRRLNKGIIVKKILRHIAAGDDGEGVDFILCMGDDVSDEKMFSVSVFMYNTLSAVILEKSISYTIPWSHI